MQIAFMSLDLSSPGRRCSREAGLQRLHGHHHSPPSSLASACTAPGAEEAQTHSYERKLRPTVRQKGMIYLQLKVSGEEVFRIGSGVSLRTLLRQNTEGGWRERQA